MPSRIRRSRAKRESRYDQHGEFRLMTEASGYVMYRRPGRLPSVMSRKEWDALADRPPQTAELANA